MIKYVIAIGFVTGMAVAAYSHATAMVDDSLTLSMSDVTEGHIFCKGPTLEAAEAQCDESLEKACPLGIKILHGFKMDPQAPGDEFKIAFQLLCRKNTGT